MQPKTVASEDELYSILSKQRTFKAKVAVPIKEMRSIKYWLILNFGKKGWSITDHQGREFCWRQVAGAVRSKQLDLMNMPITLIVSLTNKEDLLLFMLTWPSELLLNE